MVSVRELRKSYPQQTTPAVDGVSFDVGAGRICALLGGNGAGKTTTMRVLTTLARPDGGSASVCGHDVATDPAAVRRVIGLVGQDAAVDELLTARDNLLLFGRLSGLRGAALTSRASELLEMFGLDESSKTSAKKLSGGMRRKLDLAASLMTTPSVLFVDEPTTGVDPQGRVDLWEQLRALAADGTAILLTTQYLEEADALADDVVVMREGRVIASGTRADLQAMAGEPQMVLREPTIEDVYHQLYGTTGLASKEST